MSKKIDTSDLSVLSEDDLQYLLDRGKITLADIPNQSSVKTQPGDSTSEKSDDNGDADGDAVSLDDMSASQLKAEAEARGLSKGGSKQDLIERIKDHDAGLDGDDEELIEE